MYSTSTTLDQVKFPKIKSKPKSLPEEKNIQSLLNQVSAKAWLYYTAETQYGKSCLT